MIMRGGGIGAISGVDGCVSLMPKGGDQLTGVAGLGLTASQQQRYADHLYCASLGPLQYVNAKCRALAAEAIADIYDATVYNQTNPGGAAPVGAPGPGAPGSTAQDNIDAFIAAQQAAIAKAEAEGYHTSPGAGWDGFTASDVANDFSDLFDFSKSAVPWVIAGAAVILLMRK